MSSGRNILWLMVLSLVCPAGVALGKRAEQAAEKGPAKPALPEIRAIQVEPESLTLHDGRDERQVLVWGVAKDGQKFDLSDEATFTSDSDVAKVDADRFISPEKA
ncbi:MAG TPA: hypothetical protein VGI81_07840, partial [Tepidisphaeraceae bacterium]